MCIRDRFLASKRQNWTVSTADSDSPWPTLYIDSWGGLETAGGGSKRQKTVFIFCFFIRLLVLIIPIVVVSLFILNNKSELLIQKRAISKYHSAGLWTNSCCSHQRKDESSIHAGQRRLFEEMGIKASLQNLFSFIYKTSFDNGLIEHELDHVLLGFSNDEPKINSNEVDYYLKSPLHYLLNECQ